MNFLKRGIISIFRQPGKAVIFLLLVLVLSSVTAGAILVRDAIENTDANLRARMRPIIAIQFDEQAFHSYIDESFDWDNFDWESDISPHELRPRLTPPNVHAIGNLPYVLSYDYMIRGILNSTEVVRYSGGHLDIGFGPNPWIMWFELRGTSSPNMVQFETELINLVEGRLFEESELVLGERTNDSHALISRELADVNNLSLGSTFTMSEYVIIPYMSMGQLNISPSRPSQLVENLYASIDMNFTIIGIYELPEEHDFDDPSGWLRLHALSDIFVPNWSLEEAQRQIDDARRAAFEYAEIELPDWLEIFRVDAGNILAYFIVEDPRDIDDFRVAVEPLLPEFHYIVDMSGSFAIFESSMVNIQDVVNMVLIASVVATLLILSLIITLFLRDRRYEMGVYLALGEKKSRILLQILIEVIAVAIVGITLAIFVGQLASSAMSNDMLINELQANQEARENLILYDISIFDQLGIPNNEMPIQEMVDAFQVTLSRDTILIFYGVGLSVVMVSTLLPVVYIITLKPKKILL